MTTPTKATTHAADCWSWGIEHYECAVREIWRLREELSKMRAEPSDEEIDSIAASMPDGAGGMLKQWGYRQFARALLARYGAQPAASVTQVGTWEPDDPRWFIWNPGIVRDSFPAGTPIYVGQPAASAEPVAQVSRKGFHRGSIVWTAAGLVADLPDGTNLYAAIDAAMQRTSDRGNHD